jgi:subtilisin family serine protease
VFTNFVKVNQTLGALMFKKSLLNVFQLTVFTSLALVGCGGGGGTESTGGVVGGGTGGTGGTAGNGTYSIVSPTKLSAMPALGSANYIPAVTDYGVGTASFVASTATDYYGGIASYAAATSSPFQLYPVVHINSSVTEAWSNGWNGNGVTISVIDDFNTVSANVKKQTPVIVRTADYDNGRYGKVRATHSIVYGYQFPTSHGSMVSNIAGGDFDGQPISTSVTATVVSGVKTGCSILVNGSSFTTDCAANYYVSSFQTPPITMDLNYKKVAGVAKKSIVVNNNVNLSASQNPIQTVADIQGHLKNSAYLGVINLSIGSDISTSGKTFDQVMAEVAKFPLTRVDAVITVAAGNGGAACATQDLNGCNAVAVAMAYQAATNSSTIVVGALSGSGSSENIATYSTRAGVLAQRFVLASGEEGEPNIVGTSFAAPRVAGIAAILKQKYPSLTSAQIANVILLSASKDINNDGTDDFSGVSPIFGHGKVSLTRALALAAAL